MDDSSSNELSDSDIMLHERLAPQRCAVCHSTALLLHCGGCKVVSYCGTAHQSAHRSSHKADCSAIKRARSTLEHAEAELRARPPHVLLPADVFNTCVGRFWSIAATRDYMKARFNAADALLRIDTVRAVERALEHYNDMLRLCRRDNLGVRDIIPHLLLRLGREQKCYDFLKWWATINDKDHYNGHYDWSDVTLPFLDVRGADAFEPVDMFCSGGTSLSHLVALTLLKLSLHLDFSAYEAEEDSGFDFRYGLGVNHEPSVLDRHVGRLVRAEMRTMYRTEALEMAETLEDQYRSLCDVVNDANPYFWERLVEEGETPSPPDYCGPGSEEEADLVLHQCQRAWQESDDAIVMIDTETWQYTTTYKGASDAPIVCSLRMGGLWLAGPGDLTGELEIRPGTGNVFPSKFEPPQPTSYPDKLFPPAPLGRSQTVRFVRRDDRRQVLVYIDGACMNNGQPNPRAGWAVVYGPPGSDERNNRCVVSGRLENRGPFGDDSVATSNRAELRAAIAALRLCDWRNEDCDRIIIATDSSYVVDGATDWARTWARNGWMTHAGGQVKNKDLWDLLLGEVERWNDQGLRVEFWKIPRERNSDADAAAKQAANGPAEAEFRDITMGPSQTTDEAGIGSGHRILALCLENESLFDACFRSLISHINSKTSMKRVTTHEAAVAMMTQGSPPSVILVADGGLTRDRKLWECVIDRLREGATVVLAGCFSSMVSEGGFNRFFARVGLPWQRGSYHRATVKLRRDAVGSHLASRLSAAYSQKALFVKNVDRSAAWYTQREKSKEAAVAFTEVGSGRLGYIGDVNGEEASDMVVLAMCGLLD